MERRLTGCCEPCSYRIGPVLLIVRTRVVAVGWLGRWPAAALKPLAWLIAWCSTRGPLRVETTVEMFSCLPIKAQRNPPDQPAPIPCVVKALAAGMCPSSN